jgi:hypothetical protein
LFKTLNGCFLGSVWFFKRRGGEEFLWRERINFNSYMFGSKEEMEGEGFYN